LRAHIWITASTPRFHRQTTRASMSGLELARRSYQQVGAERFTAALTATITDPELRALLGRLGRHGGVEALPGAIDQARRQH
jgi:hypothetical protein